MKFRRSTGPAARRSLKVLEEYSQISPIEAEARRRRSGGRSLGASGVAFRGGGPRGRGVHPSAGSPGTRIALVVLALSNDAL